MMDLETWYWSHACTLIKRPELLKVAEFLLERLMETSINLKMGSFIPGGSRTMIEELNSGLMQNAPPRLVHLSVYYPHACYIMLQ